MKLEVTPEPRYLLPDGTETLKAAEILAKEGFHVHPYINADPVLARAMVNLAPNVADYSLVLRKAKEAEAEGKYSVALTNYLQAQDIFPTSQECRLGVERNGKKVLDSMPRGR